jgi:hypothetical protein
MLSRSLIHNRFFCAFEKKKKKKKKNLFEKQKKVSFICKQDDAIVTFGAKHLARIGVWQF